jgi:solute carrier family 35 protein E1
MKRVFIVVASVLVFRNPISVQAAIGSAVGIGGVLLYSLAKQYYEELEKEKKKKLEEEAVAKPVNFLDTLLEALLSILRK